MNTYNFEQAIEGLAHGIPVTRDAKKWVILEPEGVNYQQWWGFSLEDIYANDWVDAS